MIAELIFSPFWILKLFSDNIALGAFNVLILIILEGILILFLNIFNLNAYSLLGFKLITSKNVSFPL